MATEIISKKCSKCKQIKQISEFHKDKKAKDGLQYYCKPCHILSAIKYQKTVKGKITYKRYHQSEKGKVAHRKAVKQFCIRYPERQRAKTAVNQAIRDGKLPRARTLQCHYCSAQAEQYHHSSYAPKHRLDVIPVCIKCHTKLRLKSA